MLDVTFEVTKYSIVIVYPLLAVPYSICTSLPLSRPFCDRPVGNSLRFADTWPRLALAVKEKYAIEWVSQCLQKVSNLDQSFVNY